MDSSLRLDLVDQMLTLAPCLERTTAERALSTVLEALSARLTSDEREQLAAALPARLAQIVREVPAVEAPTGLFQDVGRRAHLTAARAVELSQIALRALGEVLPSEIRSRLERNVPELAAQLEPGAVPDAPEHEPVSLAHRHDIASGRPGSTRPLSAANPRVLEHRHSVARNGDPHGDTKLSSARGLTQEREGETLAAARPGPGLRPIAFVSARTRK